MKPTTPTITIPDEAWEPCGNDDPESDDHDPRSRLLAPTIVINGLHMHLEAYAVTTLADGIQVGVGEDASKVASFQELQDTAFLTTKIAGREYILVATPFGP